MCLKYKNVASLCARVGIRASAVSCLYVCVRLYVCVTIVDYNAKMHPISTANCACTYVYKIFCVRALRACY